MVSRRPDVPAGKPGPTGETRESGQILLFSLLVVVLMSIAMGLVASLVAERQQAQRREAETIQLTAMADAVLAETLAGLADGAGSGGVAEREFGGGTIASEVRAGSGSTLEVIARATWREGTRTVLATVEVGGPRPRVSGWRVLRPSEAEGLR